MQIVLDCFLDNSNLVRKATLIIILQNILYIKLFLQFFYVRLKDITSQLNNIIFCYNKDVSGSPELGYWLFFPIGTNIHTKRNEHSFQLERAHVSITMKIHTNWN